jgi:hypothetical protein
MNCKNCGAAIDSRTPSKCSYCGTILAGLGEFTLGSFMMPKIAQVIENQANFYESLMSRGVQ